MEQDTYQFDEVRGSLIFTVSKVELETSGEEPIEGLFDLEEQNGLDVEGYVYSSSFRMHIINPRITGSEYRINYSFDPSGMGAGDALKGSFFIVTNRGEYVLPFVAIKQRVVLESSLGDIKNLFHFTNLAKSKWQEAVELFYNPGFAQIISGNDSRYANLYRGLTVKGNKNFNLEEFLIGINKKQKIEYIVDTETINIDNPTADVFSTIKIEKNGWGYTYLEIKALGDCIELSKDCIRQEDFEGNICLLDYCVRYDKLHAGKNPARIIIRSIYDRIEIDINITKSNLFKKSLIGQRKKRISYLLTRHYLDYTMKRINMNKWLMLTDELLTDKVKSDGENISISLMQAHSLIIQERFNEAKWIMDKKVAGRIEDANNEEYCYYLYLNALYSSDEYYSREVADQIKSIYDNDRTNWRIAWILIHLSEDLRRSASRRFTWIIEQVRMGCISPIIYLEAIKALSESPSLLHHLEKEEKRIILYGAKEGVLNEDIMSQVSYLVMKSKNYDPTLLRIMRHIYDKTKSDEALQSVCVQLMKGSKTGPEYFAWYEEAVDRNFPLTKLYESYMLSMDLRRDEPIPKRVLMYFSYQSSLPPAQNAYLYSYVVRNRENMQEMYLTYRESIDRFIIKQLYEGRIDHNLAYLYSNIVLEDMLTEDNLRQFSKILFKHCVTVEDKDIVSVVVVDERLKKQMSYPVSNGCAYVALLGNDYAVLLEDGNGNRYFQTREYSTEKFFVPGKIIYKMENKATDSLLFNLFLCDDSPEFLLVTDQSVERYRYLESSDEITDTYRGMIRLPLLRYYMEKDDVASADEILNDLKYEDISYKDYNELMRFMLIRGRLDDAIDFTIHFGAENFEPRLLMRLASRILERDGLYEQEKLTAILISAFERGKYDEQGLRYLVRFSRGPIKKLRNIWKAASGFDIDTYEVCERMIKQTLETGAYIGEEAAVLKEYVEGGSKNEVELRYLSYFAHENFVRGRLVDDYMFDEMERLYKVEGAITDICMLAWLQHISKDVSEYTNDDKADTISEFIRVLMVKKGIVFPFFGKFKNISTGAAQVYNQVLVEYRGTPGVKTVINYVINKQDDEIGGYSREDMTDMYGGIYVKRFILFFGESLQYYITEERSSGPQLTESGTVGKNDVTAHSEGDRYSMVNDIAIADTLKDYDTTLRLLEEYKYKEYLVNSIFSPQ